MSDCLEVIRCKDCSYWNPLADSDPYGECFNDQWSYDLNDPCPQTLENDYCSYADRRDAK